MAKKRKFLGDLEETLNGLSEAQLMGIFGGVDIDTLTDEQKAEMLQQAGEETDK